MNKTILQRLSRIADTKPHATLALVATILKTAASPKDHNPVAIFPRLCRQMKVLDERQQAIVCDFLEQFIPKVTETAVPLREVGL